MAWRGARQGMEGNPLAMSPHRQLVEAFVGEQIRSLRWRGGWLDVGGGRRPARGADVTLDLSGPVSVHGDVGKLPFFGATFRIVTAVEMLYLVTDIRAALGEMYRVLTAGGHLIVTCPFSRPRNERGDWRRPTDEAWLGMLAAAGFRVTVCEPLGGPGSIIWQSTYLMAPGRVLKAFTARTAPAGRWLDRHSGAEWPLAYGLVAVKPEAPADLARP